MSDYSDLAGWARFVNQILDGRVYPQPYVRIGPTPAILRRFGLGPHDLVMTPGKVVRVSNEHPEISRGIWQALPELLKDPVAVLPSQRRDGSIVPVLVCRAEIDVPIFVPIMPIKAGNVVLSVYGRENGAQWIEREARIAHQQGDAYFLKEDFAAAVPKPGSVSEDTIPSSPGSIPADGATKPRRYILSARPKSTGS